MKDAIASLVLLSYMFGAFALGFWGIRSPDPRRPFAENWSEADALKRAAAIGTWLASPLAVPLAALACLLVASWYAPSALMRLAREARAQMRKVAEDFDREEP